MKQKREECRSRTPSGTELNNIVKDIRTFFSSNAQANVQPKGRNPSRPMNSQGRVSVNAQTSRKLVRRARRLRACSGPAGVKINKQQTDTDHDNDDSWCEDDNSEGEKHNLGEDENCDQQDSDDFLQRVSTILQNCNVKKNNGRANLVDDKGVNKSDDADTEAASLRNDTEMETNTDNNPATMQISAVIELFKQLRDDMRKESKKQENQIRKDLKSDFQQLTNECITAASQEINSVLEEESSNIKSVSDELNFWKMKSETLMEVCDRMNTEIADLTTRIDNLELNHSKKMVIITGLRMDHSLKKREGIHFLASFLQDNIRVCAAIDDYYTLGVLEPRPIVLILQSIEDKRNILQAKNNLKDLQHRIYINEFLPPTAQEKKKRETEIFTQFEKSGMKEELSFGKGGLQIQRIPYRKRVTPPTPKQIVGLEPEQLDKILNIKSESGAEVVQDNSVFKAYVVKANNHEEIQEAYIQMKMIQPEARHIVCAYWINDPTLKPCYAQDYHDDGEPGAGRVLLNLLKENLLSGHVLFVARKYGGIRMGTERFSCYIKAAKIALLLPTDNPTSSRSYGNKQKPSVPKDVPNNRRAVNARSYSGPAAGKGPPMQPAYRPSTPGFNRMQFQPFPMQQFPHPNSFAFAPNYNIRQPHINHRARQMGNVRQAVPTTQNLSLPSADSRMDYQFSNPISAYDKEYPHLEQWNENDTGSWASAP